MADSCSDTVLLRSLELRILRCSLSPTCSTEQTSPCTPSHQNLHLRLAEELVSLIEKGDYVGALSISELGQLTAFEFSNSWNFEDDDSIEGAEQFYLELNKNLNAFLLPHESNFPIRGFLLFCVGVAAFLAFTQNNLTGPCVSLPSFPFVFMRGKESNGMEKWDIWARDQFMSTTGSALRGKFSLLQYIVYAKMLFTTVKDSFMEGNSDSFTGLRSTSLWLSRLILLQQRLSEENTSSLYESLQVLMTENINHFGKVESIESYWGTWLQEGEPLSIVSMVHLESGIIEHIYGRVDQSRKYFDTAEEASGLQVSLTGVLGVRTLDQVNAMAQRVLVANTVTPPIGGGIVPRRSCELQTSASKLGEDNLGLGSDEIHNASNVLMVPKLLENRKDAGNGDNGIQNGEDKFISLVAIQQAVILSRCLIIEKIARDDELQRWDMAPFIEAVDAQKLSYFIIQCFCNILRIRWESSRSRTKTRALLMMEKLVQSVYESFPSAVQRIPCSFAVYFPTIPALRKEFGELLVRCGMIGDALKIFEDLELWDNLIHCYCLLEKKAVAVELIKARLCELPNDPRLWCSLGDVTNIDSYYEKALEVSYNRSARAKRALARSAYNRGDYQTSKTFWESAMALNSLFPDGWFALGAAALKARDMEKALEGFQRAVQLDPDNGEAWNNLACVHMIKKKNKEAFISFTEALKFRRNNWQMWENYSKVAVNIGNFQQALEGTIMVLNMTNNKRVDAELLEAIMIEIESRISKQNPYHAASGDPNCSIPNHLCVSFGDSSDELKDKDHTLSWSRETKHLVELLGKVLQQCIRSGIGEEIWGLYARWHKIKGDHTMCSEALLKQVRSYQGADLWNNQDRFKIFARASLQLCKAYMDTSLSTGSRRELNAAEMHLRNAVKQAVNFSELEEFKALQCCLEEVRERLHATSVPSVENP